MTENDRVNLPTLITGGLGRGRARETEDWRL